MPDSGSCVLDKPSGLRAAPAGGGVLRRIGGRIGAGIVTGAADNDPSAIGTYISAGAKFGLPFLWIAPVLLPMMCVVVYLSAKLGRVYGRGLFAAIRARFPCWLLYPVMLGALAGNVIEAAADLGGIGAAVNLFVPVPVPLVVTVAAVTILCLQLWGSYALLRALFQWLALALLAYVAAALLAGNDPGKVIRGTLIPHVTLSADFLSMVVACIGTSLSAYLYTWQSNQEVEELLMEQRQDLPRFRGTPDGGLRRMRRDVIVGMVFSNVVLYFILATGAALQPSGHVAIESATQAAAALEPLAGSSAKILFALGVVGVGFLAVPVMTTGAAYTLVQAVGREGGMNARPRDAPLFYAVIVLSTAIAAALNCLGANPMKVLVWAGLVQGFLIPPLLFMILVMTGDRRMMGRHANGKLTTLLGWSVTAITFTAAVGLGGMWLW